MTLRDTRIVVHRRNIHSRNDVRGAMRRSTHCLAVALLLAACTNALPTDLPSTSPDPTPTGSSAEACPLVPAGARIPTRGVQLLSARGEPRSGPAVLAQLGGSGEEAGRASWRLCLADGSVAAGAGVCHWSADRTAVRWMIGDDSPGLGALVGPFITFEEDGHVVVLDRANGDGLIAGYRPTDGTTILVDGPSNRAAGIAHFGGLRLHDPETGEPATGAWPGPEALTAEGSLRWSCATAPPFSEGWGPGAVRVRVDEPVGELSWEASCWWGLVERGNGDLLPTVLGVDGAFIPAGEQEVAIHVTPLDDRSTFALTTAATSAGESRSSTYTVGDDPPQFDARAPDGSAGQLRFIGWRRLQPNEGDPEEPLGGPGGPTEIDGVVEWQCGQPQGRLVEVAPTAPAP
jgi:hypothetical protein